MLQILEIFTPLMDRFCMVLFPISFWVVGFDIIAFGEVDNGS